MKIICIGRNYFAHTKELNHPVPNEPLFFFKPDTALARGNDAFYLPGFAKRFEYECEVVVRINKTGKCISKEFAHNYYKEVALGLDFTARDIQNKEIADGLPWTLSKAFDSSAPVSNFISLESLGGKGIQDIDFKLMKNGTVVQQANTCQMLFSVDEIISHISQNITLKIGDLIFTGTPFGVGQILVGDCLEGFLEEEPMFKIRIK